MKDEKKIYESPRIGIDEFIQETAFALLSVVDGTPDTEDGF